MRLLISTLALSLALPALALDPGALIAIGMESDNPDTLSLLALQDIPAGTQLFVTDNGVNGDDSFRENEGTVSWTSDAPILAGTEVHFEFGSDSVRVGGVQSGAAIVSVSGSLALSSSGDQPIVYTMDGDTIEFVTAITNDGWLTEGDAEGSSESRIPSTLVGTGYAVDSTLDETGASPEADNVVYDCLDDGSEQGTVSELVARINAVGAFRTSNSTSNPPPPPGCNWVVVSECDDVCSPDDACPADCVIFDAFDNGLDGWTMGSGASANVTNPAGGLQGDGYLSATATGVNGPGGKLTVFNESQWTGDWPALGRDAVYFHARSDTPLTLRLIVETSDDPDIRANSTVGYDLPGDGEWHVVAFDAAPSDFTLADQGTDTNAILSDVTRLRIAHLPDATASRPPNIAATLDLDSISTEPLPNVCGDSMTAGDEICDGSDNIFDCTDDGYTNPGTVGCTDTCDDVIFSECEADCGDSNVEPGEDCDSGGVNGADCDLDCTDVSPTDGVCNEAAGETPVTAPFDCADICGDGIATGDEECDGNDLNGGACSDLGYTGGDLACGDTCTFDASGCTSTCGNGVDEPDEACDDGVETANCTAECTVPTCGDGICSPLAGEDAGSCEADCDPVCGDALVTHNEVCDSTVPTGADCTSQGYTSPGGAECSATCDAIDYSGCQATCGDLNVEPGEACDDGGIAADDGCSPTCTVEVGYECNPVDGCEPVCGDGFVVGDEVCDDDDLDDGDGCAADCTVEDGFVCDDGEPTLCLVDTDEDGVADDEDNCPDDANPDQEDDDLDGVGDACEEADTDIDTDDDTDPLDTGDGVVVDTGNPADARCGCQTQGPASGLLALPLLLLGLRRRR